MPSESELLSFFKALADANRLRIHGLLAARPYSVEELATVLGLGASTVSHHVSKLVEAGLLTGRADGHYHVYSLDEGALAAKAKQMLARSQQGVLERYQVYEDLATRDGSRFHPV